MKLQYLCQVRLDIYIFGLSMGESILKVRAIPGGQGGSVRGGEVAE